MRSVLSLFLVLFAATAQQAAFAKTVVLPSSTGPLKLRAKIITADLISHDFQASGDVLIDYDQDVLEADEIKGNFETHAIYATRAHGSVGALFIRGEQISTRRVPIPNRPGQYGLQYVVKNGATTTCDLAHPDYRIQAREIIIKPGDSATANKVSLWLGNVKIITLPRLITHIGGERRAETFFPTPGVDSKDGLFLGIIHTVVDTEKTDGILRLRLTELAGVQGGILVRHTIAGDDKPMTLTRDTDLSLRRLLIPTFDEDKEMCPAVIQSRMVHSQANVFGQFLHNEHVYDVNNRHLLLSQEPQVGARWMSAPHSLLGKSLSVYVAAETSYGRFRESSGVSGSRGDVRMAAAALPIPISKQTFFQPALSLRSSGYDNRDTYQTMGLSGDLSQKFGRAYSAIRLLSYSIHGNTPFEFDDVDRPHQVQGLLAYCGKNQGASLLLRYDASRNVLYDWEATYTLKLHCLQPTFTWRNRFGMFTIDLKVLGLN
jgi:hypothetical protein